MSKWYTQDSNHSIAKLLKMKGYTEFEYGGSQFHNEYSGWWVESLLHRQLNGVWLGQTLKDSIFTLKNTNRIPLNEK
jgi:hypothetical protein